LRERTARIAALARTLGEAVVAFRFGNEARPLAAYANGSKVADRFHMKRLTISAAFLTLLAVPGARATGEAPAPAQRLPAPEHVTSETRAELGARMGRHAETMSTLIRSVVLLDRPTIRALASRMADEELIARASANKSVVERRKLNLPQEFFAEQTALSVAARELAAAAVDGGNDEALADRFSALTRTCVGCHSAYLHARPAPRPLGPKVK